MKCRTKHNNLFAVDDNKQIVVTAGEMKRNFEREFEKRLDELYDRIKADIAPQIMATCLVELHNEFGFGKDRLNRFKRGCESLYIMMESSGICGKPFTPQNCIDLMREKYDIDLEIID